MTSFSHTTKTNKEGEAMKNDIFKILFPKYYLNGKKVRLIELFGGIGSQAKAFEILNKNYPNEVIFEHYRLVEFDEKCIISYNAIHNTKFKVLDITKLSADDLGIKTDNEYIYVLTYSFPCQDISTAGLQKGFVEGSGTRSSLLWEVVRLLNELSQKQLPQVLLMENVAALENSRNIEGFRKLQIQLENLGYKNYVEQLNLKDFGIPQNRLRCFMISIKGNYDYAFPQSIPLQHFLQDFLQDIEEINDRYFLSPNLLNLFLDKKPHGGYVRFLRFKPFYYDSKDIAWTLETRQGGHPNNNYILYPKEMYNKNKNVGIMTRDNKDVVTRNLTPYECFSIMGFEPKDYDKVKMFISPTQMIKQTGNSIGVTVLIAIISKLYKDIDYEKVINQYVQDIFNEHKFRKKFPKI